MVCDQKSFKILNMLCEMIILWLFHFLLLIVNVFTVHKIFSFVFINGSSFYWIVNIVFDLRTLLITSTANRSKWWSLLGTVLVWQRYLCSGCVHSHPSCRDTCIAGRVAIKPGHLMLQGCWEVGECSRDGMSISARATDRYCKHLILF